MRGMLLIYSAICLNGMVCSAFFRPKAVTKGKPKSKQTETKDLNKEKDVRERMNKWIKTHLPFTLYMIGYTLTMMGHAFVHAYLPLRGDELEISATKRASLMSIIGITGMFIDLTVYTLIISLNFLPLFLNRLHGR